MVHEVDFLFIGMGASNCLLIMQMHHQDLLRNKSIAILEPSQKNQNDRTFCFWAEERELEPLQLHDLISSHWNSIQVSDQAPQAIAPMSYYHIRGLDLYNKVRTILGNYHVTYFPASYHGTPALNDEIYEVKLNDSIVRARKVFDSRSPKFEIPRKHQSHLLQSFYGWEVKVESSSFDPSCMVMMDFEIPQNEYCQFMYVLPFTTHTALFEVTRFGVEKICKAEAKILLENYLHERGLQYEIVEEEEGVIPMSTAEIQKLNHGRNWFSMGAQAHMVKPSTGYAFHKMAQDASYIALQLKTEKPLVRAPRSARFDFYDRLLLKILQQKPDKGRVIFKTLFKSTAVKDVLVFLNERSSLLEEIRIFSKLPILLFIHAAMLDFWRRLRPVNPVLVAFASTIVSLWMHKYQMDEFIWLALGTGFLSVGLSHGAVDHLTLGIEGASKALMFFVLKYLAIATIIGLLWIVLPDLALFSFIGYSAWHFGQADFVAWKYRSGLLSFFWGSMILLFILSTHFPETLSILRHIKGLKIQTSLLAQNVTSVQTFSWIIGSFGLLMGLLKKSWGIILTMLYLIIASYLPLLASFGIYFVMQHSIHGWQHLTSSLQSSSYKLWIKSLPFTAAAIVFLSIFIWFNPINSVGLFFILISCISMPHVFLMHRFYSTYQ